MWKSEQVSQRQKKCVWMKCSLRLTAATLIFIHVPIHVFDLCDAILCFWPCSCTDTRRIIYTLSGEGVIAYHEPSMCNDRPPIQVTCLFFYFLLCLPLWVSVVRGRLRRPSVSLLHGFTDPRPAEKCLCMSLSRHGCRNKYSRN